MPDNTDYNRAIQVINNSKKVIITSHMRPDGDACGSITALTGVMESMGKEVYPVLLTPLASWYEYLFDKTPPILGNDLSMTGLEALGQECDTIIIVDTNSQVQLPKFADFLKATRKDKTVLVIDHHVTGDSLGDVELIDTTAAAAGEIVHEIIKLANWPITEKIAQSLFVAIATDTGWFKFANTDSRLLRDAADLLDAGVNPANVFRKMYQNFSAPRMKLLALVLDRIKLHFDSKVAIQYILRKDFDDTGTTGTDTENLIDECQRIQSVEVAAMFVELKDGGFRCSLRSKGLVNVGKIAQDNGGGGHKMASGVNLAGPLDNAIETILTAVEKQI